MANKKSNVGGINWKVRAKNPMFWFQVFLAGLTPLLAYVGLSWTDITAWNTVGELFVEAYSNPYLLGLIVVSVYNAINDPIVKGFRDSRQALEYENPKENK